MLNGQPGCAAWGKRNLFLGQVSLRRGNLAALCDGGLVRGECGPTDNLLGLGEATPQL